MLSEQEPNLDHVNLWCGLKSAICECLVQHPSFATVCTRQGYNLIYNRYAVT